MPLRCSDLRGHRSLQLGLVLAVPVLVKLFFLQADKVFEPHTMALEWIASGHFRYNYLGAWDHAFQFPVYTAVVAAIHLCGGGDHAVLLFQVLCGAGTAYTIHRIALLLLHALPYAWPVGMVTALLTGLSPFLAYYQVRMIHPFAWDMLLATVLFGGALGASPHRPRSLVLLFLLGGLAVLNRPTLGVFVLPFVLRQWRFVFSLRAMGLKVVLLVLFCAPLVGWVLRNHAVTGRYQLTSVTDQMRWMGVQEETEGSGQLPNGDNYLYLLSVPERQLLFTLDPAERSQFFHRKWQEECTASPGLRWRMFAIKLKNFWLHRSHPGTDQAAAAWAMVLFKGYTAVMLVVLLAAVAFRQVALLPVGASVLALSLVQCAFYFETRHRLLVEPLLMLVAVTTVVQLYQRWQAARHPG
ncbi:MAG: hypothetical protein JNM62_04360 [Flavobacteriales bacterium]|nr:hypothetical protein [Flavobacteriales bacterium]